MGACGSVFHDEDRRLAAECRAAAEVDRASVSAGDQHVAAPVERHRATLPDVGRVAAGPLEGTGGRVPCDEETRGGAHDSAKVRSLLDPTCHYHVAVRVGRDPVTNV